MKMENAKKKQLYIFLLFHFIFKVLVILLRVSLFFKNMSV